MVKKIHFLTYSFLYDLSNRLNLVSLLYKKVKSTNIALGTFLMIIFFPRKIVLNASNLVSYAYYVYIFYLQSLCIDIQSLKTLAIIIFFNQLKKQNIFQFNAICLVIFYNALIM